MLRARTLVYVLLLAAFVVGAVRAVPAGQGGFVGGMPTGVGVSAAIAAVVGLCLGLSASRCWQRRKDRGRQGTGAA